MLAECQAISLLFMAGGLVSGLGVGWVMGRQRMHREMVGNARAYVGPVPEAIATLPHRWYDTPSLIDPMRGIYVYQCKDVACKAQMRRIGPRRGVPGDSAGSPTGS